MVSEAEYCDTTVTIDEMRRIYYRKHTIAKLQLYRWDPQNLVLQEAHDRDTTIANGGHVEEFRNATGK